LQEKTRVFVNNYSIPIDSGPERRPVGTAVREEKYIVVTTFKMHLVWIHGKIQLLKGYASLVSVPIIKFGKVVLFPFILKRKLF
jgi:hypothetical protein